MKTAMEIFKDSGGDYYPYNEAIIVSAMKAYASQAIDRAAEVVKTKRQPIRDGHGVLMDAIGVDKQSILKIKEELK